MGILDRFRGDTNAVPKIADSFPELDLRNSCITRYTFVTSPFEDDPRKEVWTRGSNGTLLLVSSHPISQSD